MNNSLKNFVRGIRSVAWFVVGVLISALLIFPDAYAADYPAYSGWRSLNPVGPVYTYHATGLEACQAQVAVVGGAWFFDSYSGGVCMLRAGQFTVSDRSSYISSGNYCPAGGTYSSGTCVGATACASGEVRNSQGICAPLLCISGTSVGPQTFFGGHDTNGDGVVDAPTAAWYTTSFTGCLAGCQIRLASQVSGANSDLSTFSYVGAPSKIYTTGNYENTSSTCTDQSTPDTPDSSSPCPAGQSYGTVNGIPRCVGSSDPAPPPPKKSTTNTGKVDNGDGTSTVTSTTTTNNSTSTTISIVNNTTGATTSSTTTTASSENPKTDQAKFCEDNPDSPMCKVSSISGSCSAVSCDGDAIQCAIAREQQKRNCVLYDTATPLSTLGAAVAAGADPDASLMPWHPSKVSTVDVAGGISQATWFSASGISDKTFSLRGQTVTIPFSNLNSILSIMGSIIVAFSLLAAARIVGVIS